MKLIFCRSHCESSMDFTWAKTQSYGRYNFATGYQTFSNSCCDGRGQGCFICGKYIMSLSAMLNDPPSPNRGSPWINVVTEGKLMFLRCIQHPCRSETQTFDFVLSSFSFAPDHPPIAKIIDGKLSNPRIFRCSPLATAKPHKRYLL